MAGTTSSNDIESRPGPTTERQSLVPGTTTAAVWLLHLLSLVALGLVAWGGYAWNVPGILVVDGLTVVMWVVVTFFSGIVHSYSRRYMAGDRRIGGFFARLFAFTLFVMTMTAADHVALFAAAWLAMGLVMASLIGHVREWTQARLAAKSARRYFLASSGFLALGLGLLAWSTGAASISGIFQNLGEVSDLVALAAVGSLFLAAIVQSALFPFHKWLLSSMTAPTPASALMHAGFVNAGGILLTRFAPLFVEHSIAMALLVLVGGISAVFGQAMLLVGTDVKRKLGASTVAQMGFMILQCGLGFFAAAITHLVLHGFYKAYLFLSSGAAVERTTPDAEGSGVPRLQRVIVGLLTALGGGAVFALLTGKGTELNSGLVLTFVVVVTTMHATRDILRRSSLPASVRLVSVPLVALTAIGVYSVTFNAISTIIAGAQMAKAPTGLTVAHLAVVGLFVASYLAMEFDWHRDRPRLYVALLNASQPISETVLTRKVDYDDA